MGDKAILYDAARCTACRGCQAACKQWNENDEHIPTPAEGNWTRTYSAGTYENPPDLSPETWLRMQFMEIEGNGNGNGNGGVRFLFNRQACMHCTDAGCVNVCPNGSLYHHELGFVAFNKDTCIGCGYCVQACPFNVPRYTRNTLGNITKMDKCTFCTSSGLDRIAADLSPACVGTCPPEALQFGDRDELLAMAKQRVEALKSRGFADANLYGENELGGLHVLYVLDESPALYGLPLDPRIPPITFAWKDIIQPVGWVLGGLTTLGLAMNYVVARRAKVAKERAASKETQGGE